MRQLGMVAGHVGRIVPLSLLAVAPGGDALLAAMLTDVQRRFASSPASAVLLCLRWWPSGSGRRCWCVAAGWVVPWAIDGQATAGLLVGLALVATMPVANSSVGWTQNADGNLG